MTPFQHKTRMWHEKIVATYEKERNIAEVGRIYGISRQAVHKILLKLGVKVDKRWTKAKRKVLHT